MSNGSSLSLQNSKTASRLFVTTSGSWLNKPLHSQAPRMKLETRTGSHNKLRSLKAWSSNEMRC